MNPVHLRWPASRSTVTGKPLSTNRPRAHVSAPDCSGLFGQALVGPPRRATACADLAVSLGRAARTRRADLTVMAVCGQAGAAETPPSTSTANPVTFFASKKCRTSL